MPPPDFFHHIDVDAVTTLSEAQAAGLLGAGGVRRARGIQGSVLVEATHLERLNRRALPAPPIDRVKVGVSAPVVLDEDGGFVAGVLFRRASHVVPAAVGEGSAQYGEERFEDFYYTEPPLPGAVLELTFVPPRRNARYLIEFGVHGESISVAGTDGTSLTSAGAFSVVHYSNRSQVTYTLSSGAYWWFTSATITWMTNT